jgi:sterol desaturase/sphingolipid hydroxylase (fatty acid hydroxylase superfamily)
MPTPLEILASPVTLAAAALYGAVIAWEALFPARVLPSIPGWRTRGLAAFVVYVLVSSYLPLVWDAQFARFQVFDLTGLSIPLQVAAGVLIYEAGVYAWHRTMHGSDALWRLFHQMHHSAERIDTFGAYWFSPLDMAGWTLLASLALVLIVGLAPEATTAVLLIVTFLAVFQHANIRTPRWLGYLIQRPESHSHHHARGVHAMNYSDLPLFDLAFGTFVNPKDFAAQAGFYDGASARVVDMLRFRDVSKPQPRPASHLPALSGDD